MRNKVWYQYIDENQCFAKFSEIFCEIISQNNFSESDLFHLFKIFVDLDIDQNLQISKENCLLNPKDYFISCDFNVRSLIFSNIFFNFLTNYSLRDFDIKLSIYNNFLSVCESNSISLVDFSKLSLIKNLLICLAREKEHIFMDLISAIIIKILQKNLEVSTVKLLFDIFIDENFYLDALQNAKKLINPLQNDNYSEENNYFRFLANVFHIFQELGDDQGYFICLIKNFYNNNQIRKFLKNFEKLYFFSNNSSISLQNFEFFPSSNFSILMDFKLNDHFTKSKKKNCFFRLDGKENSKIELFLAFIEKNQYSIHLKVHLFCDSFFKKLFYNSSLIITHLLNTDILQFMMKILSSFLHFQRKKIIKYTNNFIYKFYNMNNYSFIYT